MTHRTRRTPDEIVARIEEVGPQDIFGHQVNDLVEFLPYDRAIRFLKEGITSEDWGARRQETPAELVRDYLPFAWEKANECRGLSAGRSLEHMKAWLWLDGLDKVLPRLSNYDCYGKGQLVLISEIYGYDWYSVDNGVWTNHEGHVGLSNLMIHERVREMRALAQELKS
jgi:hypothetical protein